MIESPEPERRKIVIAKWAAREVDILIGVPARARPSAGESGAIADAVASMARRVQNQARIAQIEQAVKFLESVVECDTYDDVRPDAPSALAADELARLDANQWR